LSEPHADNANREGARGRERHKREGTCTAAKWHKEGDRVALSGKIYEPKETEKERHKTK
jgi:hypothetical protein